MNQITTRKSPDARIPVTPVNWLRQEIDRLFDDFGGARSLFDFSPRTYNGTPSPAVELTETEKEFRLTAELPGMSDKDVTIEIADDVLTISGEKKEESERKDEGYILSERRYGAFRRRISVPEGVDPDRIEAKFANGLLTVTMPKDASSPARSRKIEIKA